MSIGNYITIAIFVIGLIVTLVNSRTTKQTKLQVKVDKADHDKQIDMRILPIKERLKVVEGSVSDLKALYDLAKQDMDNKFERMIEENQRQGSAMERQANHIEKVFEEITKLSVSIAKIEDK